MKSTYIEETATSNEKKLIKKKLKHTTRRDLASLLAEGKASEKKDIEDGCGTEDAIKNVEEKNNPAFVKRNKLTLQVRVYLPKKEKEKIGRRLDLLRSQGWKTKISLDHFPHRLGTGAWGEESSGHGSSKWDPRNPGSMRHGCLKETDSGSSNSL